MGRERLIPFEIASDLVARLKLLSMFLLYPAFLIETSCPMTATSSRIF